MSFCRGIGFECCGVLRSVAKGVLDPFPVMADPECVEFESNVKLNCSKCRIRGAENKMPQFGVIES